MPGPPAAPANPPAAPVQEQGGRPTHLILDVFVASFIDYEPEEEATILQEVALFLRRMDVIRATADQCLPRQQLNTTTHQCQKFMDQMLALAKASEELGSVCSALRFTAEIVAAFHPKSKSPTNGLEHYAAPITDLVANRLLTEPSSGNGGMDRFSVLKSILDHINVHAQESKSVKEQLGMAYMDMILLLMLHGDDFPPVRQMIPLRRQAGELLNDELLSGSTRNLERLRALCPPERVKTVAARVNDASDFKLQSYLFEIVFRLAPADRSKREELARSLWPSPALSNAFLSIVSASFAAGSRVFLNLLNDQLARTSSSAAHSASRDGDSRCVVLSTPCVAITYNGVIMQQPKNNEPSPASSTAKKSSLTPKSPRFWLDINLHSISVDAIVPNEDIVDLIEAPFVHINRFDIVKGKDMGGLPGSVVLKLQLTSGVASIKALTPDFRQAVLVCECVPANVDAWISDVRTIIGEKKTERVSAPNYIPIPTPIVRALKSDGLASPMLGTKTMSPLRTGGFPAEQIFELFDKYSSRFSQPESPPPDTTKEIAVNQQHKKPSKVSEKAAPKSTLAKQKHTPSSSSKQTPSSSSKQTPSSSSKKTPSSLPKQTTSSTRQPAKKARADNFDFDDEDELAPRKSPAPPPPPASSKVPTPPTTATSAEVLAAEEDELAPARKPPSPPAHPPPPPPSPAAAARSKKSTKTPEKQPPDESSSLGARQLRERPSRQQPPPPRAPSPPPPARRSEKTTVAHAKERVPTKPPTTIAPEQTKRVTPPAAAASTPREHAPPSAAKRATAASRPIAPWMTSHMPPPRPDKSTTTMSDQPPAKGTPPAAPRYVTSPPHARKSAATVEQLQPPAPKHTRTPVDPPSSEQASNKKQNQATVSALQELLMRVGTATSDALLPSDGSFGGLLTPPATVSSRKRTAFEIEAEDNELSDRLNFLRRDEHYVRLAPLQAARRDDDTDAEDSDQDANHNGYTRKVLDSGYFSARNQPPEIRQPLFFRSDIRRLNFDETAFSDDFVGNNQFGLGKSEDDRDNSDDVRDDEDDDDCDDEDDEPSFSSRLHGRSANNLKRLFSDANFLGAPRRTNSSSTRFSRGGTIDHEDDEDGEDGFPSLHDPAIRSLLQALEDRLRRKATHVHASSMQVLASKVKRYLKGTRKLDEKYTVPLYGLFNRLRSSSSEVHDKRESHRQKALYLSQKLQLVSGDLGDASVKRRRVDDSDFEGAMTELRSMHRHEAKMVARLRQDLYARFTHQAQPIQQQPPPPPSWTNRRFFW